MKHFLLFIFGFYWWSSWQKCSFWRRWQRLSCRYNLFLWRSFAFQRLCRWTFYCLLFFLLIRNTIINRIVFSSNISLCDQLLQFVSHMVCVHRFISIKLVAIKINVFELFIFFSILVWILDVLVSFLTTIDFQFNIQTSIDKKYFCG